MGRRSSKTACRVRSVGLPEGREERFGVSPRGPGSRGSRGERPRPGSFGLPRVGVGARRAGRQLPGPSPASPPPGFLRRPRPPCCCGAEAAPAEASALDRLRNRFAGGRLTTDAAAAAAEQGLPHPSARARCGCRGARGRAVTCGRRGARWPRASKENSRP